MASQTLTSTKKDVVDLGIGEIELTGRLAADERQPNAGLFLDGRPHLLRHPSEDDFFHAAALMGRSGLQLPMVVLIEGRPP